MILYIILDHLANCGSHKLICCYLYVHLFAYLYVHITNLHSFKGLTQSVRFLLRTFLVNSTLCNVCQQQDVFFSAVKTTDKNGAFQAKSTELSFKKIIELDISVIFANV